MKLMLKKSYPVNYKVIKEHFISACLVLLGTLIFSVAINAINVPNQLGEGGVTGLTLLLYYASGIPISWSYFILNMIVLIVGIKYLDKITIIYTVLSFASMSLFLEYLKIPAFLPENSLITPIASGFLVGLGLGIVIKGRGTTAGSDIIALIINKYIGISIPIALLMIDVLIVIPLTYQIGLEKGILTIISLTVASKVMNIILEGFNPKYAIMVISERHDDIAREITTQIHRGVTVLKGYGYFSKHDKQILYVVVNRLQILPIQKIIYSLDDRAFVTISNVQQVLGEGFSFMDDSKNNEVIHIDPVIEISDSDN